MIALRGIAHLRFGLPRSLAGSKRRARLRSVWYAPEALEDRHLLTTFTVTNLRNSGEGSLRWAIVAANTRPGADRINFGVAGTMRVGQTSLPAITGEATIDGSTSPPFEGTPVVIIDFRGTRGLTFDKGSDGSALRSLSLVRAGTAGVTLNASFVAVQGNDIGILPDGRVAGNRGDGVRINASSHGDLIGRADPVSSVTYDNAASVPTLPVSVWQGIRGGTTTGQYLITGTSGSSGLLYEGPITGTGGTSYAVNVPGATTSSVYGPNQLADGSLQLVGSYKNGTGTVDGFLFQGTTAELAQMPRPTRPSTIRARNTPTSTARWTAWRSAMPTVRKGNAPLGTGHAFLDNIASGLAHGHRLPGGDDDHRLRDLVQRRHSSYTIVGGFSGPGESGSGLSHGYMVDYNSSTGLYDTLGLVRVPEWCLSAQNFITHFEGVSSDEKGVYTLVADSIQSGSSQPRAGLFRDRPTGTTTAPSGPAELGQPELSPASTRPRTISSANSVAGNAVVGEVDRDFGQLRRSSPGSIHDLPALERDRRQQGATASRSTAGSNNQVAMNFIGTDPTGTARRGNQQGTASCITDGAAGESDRRRGVGRQRSHGRGVRPAAARQPDLRE